MSNWITLSQNSGTSGTTTISVTANSTSSPRSCTYKVATADEEIFVNVGFVQAADSHFFTVFYNSTGGSTYLMNPSYNGSITGYRVDNGAYVSVQPGYMPASMQFSTPGIHRLDYYVTPEDTGPDPTVERDPNIYYVCAYLFQNNENAVEVIVPYGFHEIEYAAFCGCTNISAVTLGDSIYKIHGNAFANTGVVDIVCPYFLNKPYYATVYSDSGVFSACTSLTSITFSDHMLVIPDETCRGCSQLVNVNYPSYLKEIGNSAFYGCESLEEINIPSSVNSIGEGAFSFCSSASGSVVVPDGVEDLENLVFYGCSSITDINLPNGLISISQYALGNMTSLTAITIPQSVVKIGSYAFSGDTGLTSISFPENVASIGNRVLYNCSNITTIYSYALSAPIIERLTFANISATGTLHYPSGSDYSVWVDRLPDGWICLADL